jgi:hypothetical protein
VEARIDGLGHLSRTDLVVHWQSAFRSDPPKGISMRLMVRAIAYAIQAKRYGGLKAATRRRLEVPLEKSQPAGRPATSAPLALRPGTRLVREWNGMTHVVDVVESGYIWNGSRHNSLSAIARAITGARWSGPRFFGLNGDQQA